MMDWITGEIAIGNYLEAQDGALHKERGIASVLSLDGTLENKKPAEMGLQDLEVYSLVDGHGNDPRLFAWAVDSLVRLVRDSAPVLVQCHAGRSRSAIVVAAYLMKTRRMDAESALAYVASRRSVAVTVDLLSLLDRIAD